MKRCYFLILLFTAVLSVSLNAQDKFIRKDTISVRDLDKGGWGEVVAGVDLDKDGKPEIYACNSNAVDDPPSQLTPRLYKFELTNNKWELVWSAEVSDIEQNTWPALTTGDLDKDGKAEIIWGPANWVDDTYPNPARILVFEVKGDGSDNLGVESFGKVLPNAKYTITPDNKVDMRPFTWFVEDYDADGQSELIYCDRRAGTGLGFGIVSVDKIPDDGDGSEKWTLEMNGKDPKLTGFTIKTYYDIVYLNNVFYLFDINGLVTPIKYSNNTWTVLPVQKNVAGTTGSYKSAQVVDINKDGTKEIVFGGWSDGKIYLSKQVADTLDTKQIGNVAKFGVPRLVGGGAGDLDKDGKIDFVFGSRNGVGNHFNAVVRLQYKGGDIADSNSYVPSVIDSLIDDISGQLDIVTVADVDKDGIDEVVYSSGYPLGTDDFPNIPIVILKDQNVSGVMKELSNIPDNFFLAQNFPNPFNPSTTIKFGLPGEAVVSLRVFNLLGQEVATLINSQHMTAGSYNFDFNASKLASGTYIYQLSYNNQIVNRKMLLMK